MKAIILAAGKGSRLGGITLKTPKPMLKVNNKPILERIIIWLKQNEINEIGINLHTIPEQICSYFGTGKKYGVNIFYVHEEKLTGTAGALPAFTDWLDKDKDFLVVYGDILTDQCLTPLIDLHKKHNAFATLFLHRRNMSNSYIETNKENRIIKFLERPEEKELELLAKKNRNGFLVNSAIQILSRDALNYINKNSCFDLPRDVYMANPDKKIYGLELTGKRVAIDSPERLKLAETIFK